MLKWNAVTNYNGVSVVTSYLTSYVDTWNYVQYAILTDGTVAKTVKEPENSSTITNAHILLDLHTEWSTTGESQKYDIQTAVEHELGHAIGIAHCHETGPSCSLGNCPNNVMTRTISTGTIRTTLTSYDIAAYRYIY